MSFSGIAFRASGAPLVTIPPLMRAGDTYDVVFPTQLVQVGAAGVAQAGAYTPVGGVYVPEPPARTFTMLDDCGRPLNQDNSNAASLRRNNSVNHVSVWIDKITRSGLSANNPPPAILQLALVATSSSGIQTINPARYVRVDIPQGPAPDPWAFAEWIVEASGPHASQWELWARVDANGANTAAVNIIAHFVVREQAQPFETAYGPASSLGTP